MVAYKYDALGRKEEVKHVTMITSGISLPIGRTLNDTTLSNVTISNKYEQYSSNVKYFNSSMVDIQLPGGYLKRTNSYSNTGIRPVYEYRYYVNDHLGNIRAVIDGTGAIKQVNNYTPFGTEYGESAENQTMATYQNIQFGGKEFDRKYELNFSDFGARTYDAAKGRWTTPDLLAEKYYFISPYAYCFNNPLRYVDPDGRDGIISIYGNNITISANIYLYGSGATNVVASQYQKDINSKWGGSFNANTSDGKQSFKVNVNVNVELYEGKEKTTHL